MSAETKVQQWYCRPCRQWFRSLYKDQLLQWQDQHLKSKKHKDKVKKKHQKRAEGPG